MPPQTPIINTNLLNYLRKTSLRESDVQKELRKITSKLPEAGWAVSPELGQFLALIVQITGAESILEIGTFTGHSSLAMGLVLPNEGKIITCDMEPKYTEIAQKYWIKAGIEHKIELRHGPALTTLASLLTELDAEYFDLAFIDANKKDYDAYYELTLKLIRPAGLIIIDNVFWGGKILDNGNTEKSTIAIRNLNKKLLADKRISLSMLPISDGITLAWKRHNV